MLALKEKGFTEVNIITHSAGIFEVIEALNMYPEFIKNVVAIDPTHPKAFPDVKDTLSAYWHNVEFEKRIWPSPWDIFAALNFNPDKDGSAQDMEISAIHVNDVLEKSDSNLFKNKNMTIISASPPGVYEFISSISTDNLKQSIALDQRLRTYQINYTNYSKNITQEFVPNTTHYVWGTPEGREKILNAVDRLICYDSARWN